MEDDYFQRLSEMIKIPLNEVYEKNKIELSIRETMTKIHALQYEIGVARARHPEADSVDDLELRANIARLKDCEQNIVVYKARLVEIETDIKAAKALQKANKKVHTTVGSTVTAPPLESQPVSSPVISEVAVSAPAPESVVVIEETTTERSDTVRVLSRSKNKKDTPPPVDEPENNESMAA